MTLSERIALVVRSIAADISAIVLRLVMLEQRVIQASQAQNEPMVSVHVLTAFDSDALLTSSAGQLLLDSAGRAYALRPAASSAAPNFMLTNTGDILFAKPH